MAESCEIVLGQSPPSSTYNTEGNGLPFFQGKSEFGDIYPAPKKWCSKPQKIAKPKDILISVRAPVGPTNICVEESCIGRGLAAIRPKDNMSHMYIFYYLRLIEEEWNTKATGTTFKAISGDTLRRQAIPLPLLPEQERIVERIESLLTQLDAGVAGLKRVLAALKRYRASVLKAACEGKLMEQDPNEEPADAILNRISDKLDAVTSIYNNENIRDLPKGWSWTKLIHVTDIIGGITKGRKFNDQKTISLPYLRVANVQRGYLDLSEIKKIILLEVEIEKYRLEVGDILLTEGGDWDKLGRSAIWESELDLCVHQNHIFRARLKSKEMSSKWLMYYINSEEGKNYFKSASKQTTNLASINLSQLRNFIVPIPPVHEQFRIVAEIERRLSVVVELEQMCKFELRRAARLRQSILRRAYQGKLC